MMYRKILHAALASALLTGAAAPAFGQGILDRMKEDAQRRAENKAVREAENPSAKKNDAAPAAQPAQPTQNQSSSPAPTTAAPPPPAPAQAQ